MIAAASGFGLAAFSDSVRRSGAWFGAGGRLDGTGGVSVLRTEVGGASKDVLLRQHKVACVMAGGTHHAFRAHGEGFCIFNDLAVAAAKAIAELGTKQVLIIDLDVHQGNGTAEIFENNPQVYTFSVHGDRNYPWRSRMRSDLDIALPDEVTDESFLDHVLEGLAEVSRCTGLGSNETKESDWLCFYQAGVDPLAEDRLGRLGISRQALRARNELVFSFCERHGLPLVVTMGGGYSRPIEHSAAAHTDVFAQAINWC